MSAERLSFDLLAGWADTLADAARTAGDVILRIYNSDFAVTTKADASPVTEADQAAERVVLAALEALSPKLPVVAEEQVAAKGFPDFAGNTFWLVDALDGTKEFIQRRGDFTVNIGLVVDGVPALGVVHAPVRNETFVGVVLDDRRQASVTRGGATQTIRCRQRPARVAVVGSRSHQVKGPWEAFLARHDVAETVSVGSSLKFCLVAGGKADLYPRFGPTSEWDTAAGHAVLRAAGGRVHDFDGAELRYKKSGFRNGHFLAEGPV
ncbi:MAG: 3'(2'),5'-bisphosphate nucleotidase CysQ [Rhodospirillaceae bacterium]|nr:3'(2'),5'-bisphosphate nucleotidase CysQ [Rhodospirillaceae bacterium]